MGTDSRKEEDEMCRHIFVRRCVALRDMQTHGRSLGGKALKVDAALGGIHSTFSWIFYFPRMAIGGI
jgi:hypothetical protein